MALNVKLVPTVTDVRIVFGGLRGSRQSVDEEKINGRRRQLNFVLLRVVTVVRFELQSSLYSILIHDVSPPQSVSTLAEPPSNVGPCIIYHCHTLNSMDRGFLQPRLVLEISNAARPLSIPHCRQYWTGPY